jgi:hypothetical protein
MEGNRGELEHVIALMVPTKADIDAGRVAAARHAADNEIEEWRQQSYAHERSRLELHITQTKDINGRVHAVRPGVLSLCLNFYQVSTCAFRV